MKFLIISIATATLFALFLLPVIIRTIARIAADRMIHGKKTPTVKCMNRCVRVLTWLNDWITAREESDQGRIDRLNVMLDEMQNPHD